MAIQYYINYVIFFYDLSEYNFAISIAGGPILKMAPSLAATTFGVTESSPSGSGKGMYGIAPWGLGSVEIDFPNPSGIFTNPAVLSVTVPGQAGVPASVYPAGPDGIFTWSATIVQMTSVGIVDTPSRAPVPQRRWISGFEFQSQAEGGSGGGANLRSRDSSRTVDGIGYGLRNTSSGTNCTRAVNEFRSGFTTHTSWERIYMRVRNFGLIDFDFWKTTGTPSASAGALLKIKSNGDIDVYNVNSFAVATLFGTIVNPFVIDEWIKIDILVEYNAAAALGNGRLRIYIGGINLIDITPSSVDGGLGQNSSFHISSTVGPTLTGANTWEIDFDDWDNADIPNISSVETLNSIDWLYGTHSKRVWIASGTKVNWAGTVQSMNQMIIPSNSTSGSRLTSSTALAQLVGLTNLTDLPDNVGIELCKSAALITTYSLLASGAVSGQLGYKLAGAAAALTAITEGVTAAYKHVMYIGLGTETLPATFVPFSVVYEKANSVVQATIEGLQAIVESIGAWGIEDDPDIIDLPSARLIHNAWYPTIAQVFAGSVPYAPVFAEGGTYVGNGTEHEILISAPCHFLWIRPLTGGSGGTKWYGSGLGAHLSCQGGIIPEQVIRVYFNDLTGTTQFVVAGTNANSNANGVTYQYIAFCDPAMQYNLCGMFMHSTAVASADNALVDSGFTPEAVFFTPEFLSADASTRLIYKGPGNGGTDGTLVDGTAKANVASISTGDITSLVDIHSNTVPTMFSAWRTLDECANVMVQIFSYVGDGTLGTRLIDCTPVSSRYPLLVYVQPHNNIGYTKDPSDVTTSSRKVTDGSTSATAIVSVDIDIIGVGVTLNTNSIVYDVFIIPGDSAGFNNGIFYPTACLPVGPWAPPPVPPIPGINIIPDGGLELGEEGNTPILLADISGLYTLVEGKTDDTLYDRQPAQISIEVAIPTPQFKTGYIGG